MAVTVVVEDGSGLTNANSYVSVADATTYHESNLYATDWTSATSANQDIAVVMATRLIDQNFSFHNRKINRDQALEWPRHGMTGRSGWLLDSNSLPTDLVNATAELAKWLLAGDRMAETDDRGFKRIKAGSLELEIDPADRKTVIPLAVSRMLAPFGTPIGQGIIPVSR